VNNNYYRFSVTSEDTAFNIPVEITFDMGGRNDGIVQFETDILQDLINGIDDFETTRFANKEYIQTPNVTDINYEFYFIIEEFILKLNFYPFHKYQDNVISYFKK
jgi:hypothetical protein